MRTVCFVTNEIYPEHKGGIGRMIHNIVVRNAKAGAPDRLFLLLAWQPPESQAAIRLAFSGLAEVAFCPLSLGSDLSWAQDYERSNPPAWHYGHAYRQSLMFYCCLRAFERDQGLAFDVIEFPDYGGWGLATMEAKASGLAFETTELTVRLHSTSGIVAEHQPYYHAPTPWHAAVEDMERQCLLKADRVVGHVSGVIEANRAFYGFSADWAARCAVEFPPTLLEPEEAAASHAANGNGPRDFIFSSRLQPFKQPDLFIKAAVGFFRARPDYEGRCRLISYGWDDDYIAGLRALIPARLSERITLETGVSPEERIAAVSTGIVVIPSNYESLCLFAFEASHLGAILILNDACVAFGKGSRWHEGGNCLTFDGTVDSLIRRMGDALEVERLEKVSLAPTPPYWLVPARAKTPSGRSSFSLMIAGYGFTDRAAIDRFLEAHWHDEASFTLLIPEGFDDGLDGLPARVAPTRIAGDQPWPEDIARLVGACGADLIAFCRADTRFDQAYATAARAAFAGHAGLAAFASHSRLKGRDGSFQGIRIYAGCAAGVALQSRDILPDGAVFRTATLRHLSETGRAFDGRTQKHWYTDLCRELAFDHAEMIVAPHPYIEETAPAVRQPGDPVVDGTLIERLIRRTGGLGTVRSLALKPLPRVAMPEDPRLEVSMILRGARQLWPTPGADAWRPVKFRISEKDLLVHPMAEGPVVAALPITRADVPEALTVLIHHYGTDNPGVDICLQAGTGVLNAADLSSGALPEAGMTTPWHTLHPGDQTEIKLPLPAGRDFDWLVALSRPSDGKTTAYGWTYITKVWVS